MLLKKKFTIDALERGWRWYLWVIETHKEKGYNRGLSMQLVVECIEAVLDDRGWLSKISNHEATLAELELQGLPSEEFHILFSALRKAIPDERARPLPPSRRQGFFKNK